MTSDQKIMHEAWKKLGRVIDRIPDPQIVEEITEVRRMLFVPGKHHQFTFPSGTSIADMISEMENR